ncbi:MAG: hypothetical protein E2O65_00530 [Gammaproteobacteria bacterium]|nr:MAG: hypothetical protein E2O65_00530 [Gammaproteobacteria bacterium]
MSEDRGRHVTLVVPGLLGPPMANGPGDVATARLLTEGLSLPALERFFSRATATASNCPEQGLAGLLFDCFGVAREGPDWPVAAITRRLDGAGGDGGWWLRADPVHLRVDMGELALLAGEGLRISMAEAQALAAELNGQLGDPIIRFAALAEKRWYVHLEHGPRLVTQPPWEVSGSRIGEHLPHGDDAGHWRARINDVQMILHASPVNRERERRGEPAINSLWLWGGGRTPRVPAGRWQGVWSDHTLVAGLAGLAQAASEPLPEDARSWLAGAQLAGNHLLVWSAAYVPVRCSDIDAWRGFVAAVEERWMAPLLDALKSGRVQSVSLRTGGSRDFRLRRGQLGFWWRRARPFARIMSECR